MSWIFEKRNISLIMSGFMQLLMYSCGGTRRYLLVYLVEQLQYGFFLNCSSTSWLV